MTDGPLTQLRVAFDPYGRKSRVCDERGIAIGGVHSVSVEQRAGEVPLVTVKIHAYALDLSILPKGTP